MLTRLRQIFLPDLRTDATEETPVQLAAAVLWIEVLRADRTHDHREAAAVRQALSVQFGLDDRAVDALIARAHAEATDATDDYRFTARINTLCNAEEKAQIVEHMWRIAHADDHLDAHESHYLRKIAELLHVPHSTYIAAKLRARKG